MTVFSSDFLALVGFVRVYFRPGTDDLVIEDAFGNGFLNALNLAQLSRDRNGNDAAVLDQLLFADLRRKRNIIIE